MHPMKRPRRPVQRKTVKRARTPKTKNLITFDDAVPTDKIAYQWAALPTTKEDREAMQAYVAAGWSPVRKHPKFPTTRGKVIFQGMLLMQIDAKKHRALVDTDVARARKQIDDVNKLFQIEGKRGRGENRSFPIVSSDFVVSSDYGVVPPDVDPVDVTVVVKLRLSRRFQDAAAALKLSVGEYAQRRMTMYVRGELGGLLLPVDPSGADAVELHEGGQLNLSSRI